MRRWIVVVGVALLIYAILFTGGVHYWCGRCGTQQYQYRVLGIELRDMREEEYDEYGSQNRWERAHNRPCDHIWLLELFGWSQRDAYFPSMHWSVAKGTDIDKLDAKIAAADDNEVQRKDALGRTILHWAVIHPDGDRRDAFVARLLTRGLKMNEPDDHGLSPRDWQAAFVRSATRRTAEPQP